jgi:hypothetical protein
MHNIKIGSIEHVCGLDGDLYGGCARLHVLSSERYAHVYACLHAAHTYACMHACMHACCTPCDVVAYFEKRPFESRQHDYRCLRLVLGTEYVILVVF